MKHRTNPSAAAIAAALEFQSLDAPELHRRWNVYFDHAGAPIERTYQVPVPMSRVLREHAAAIAAVPVADDSTYTLAARARLRGAAR
ncbi:hypothetical protein ACKVEX_15195 [Rhodocyclaceae bacterium SMB388]